ncbi:15-hydroxyprostaglandin dehydrogenase [NAD(+)]-like [Saccoglossus kowalevskii]|uniref:15-hydroxyprostaglandin dehydrogenase [NAD(+)] n=1 Tax=Saccoglossus kowalevskii TaxID=10224 RepID=A0ABM0MQA8_SACKO|nr:PREDICTED: 15-hydroxyprostaglandin dehydrogenase [NAD(+)]-like [Saccoglossus kowalevskii]
MEYSEKVGLITGGAEGIGRGIAERLLMNGIKGVCIIDVNKDLGEETTQYFKTQFGHGRTLFIHCDVTSKTSLRDAFKKTKECYDRIDIVCNNAGIVNELEWQTMMHVNLFAVIEGTYLGLEFMGTQHGGFGGTVINVSSSNGDQYTIHIKLRPLTGTGFCDVNRSLPTLSIVVQRDDIKSHLHNLGDPS